jgi:hypothetical protein
MDLNDRVRQMAEAGGADLFGVADLGLARDEVVRQGGEQLAAYPRAISIGIRLFDEIVDRLPDRDRMDVAVSYRHHCYDVINGRLDDLASRIAGEL